MTVEEVIRVLAMQPFYSEVEVIRDGKRVPITDIYCDGDHIMVITEGEKYTDPWV